MNIISRLLLFVYAAIVLAVLMCIGALNLNLIDWQFVELIKRQETLAAVVVMALASLCMFNVATSSKAKEIIRSEVELSQNVLVTIEAIKSVVERSAMQVAGVRQVEANVRQGNELKIRLSVVLSQGCNAVEVGKDINTAVVAALTEAMQISKVQLEVLITEVTHAIVDRERRVV